MTKDNIVFVEKEYSDEEIYRMLRPYIAKWFRLKYRTFTPPQRKAIPEIKSKNNVLISSPTGTGKTLAAFLGILDDLFELAERGTLENKVYAVYVSPLRALNNDMQRNLINPLKEIGEVGKKLGYEIPEIRVAVRTSDTRPYEKQKMIKYPPHILITTPESLAIALVAPRFRERLKNVQWIIVDEIHELCSSKRGIHLSLSIERLEEFVGRSLIRIGLSATIAPLMEVAKFLVGYSDSGESRPCKIIDARFSKPMEIKVISPIRDIVHATAEEINEAIYAILRNVILSHRTTLIFTNTRSATERVVFKLRKIFEKDTVLNADSVEAHHSSLSRNIRLAVEEKLKHGKLKAVVCVHPNTYVFTINGPIPIKNLGNQLILGLDQSNYKLIYTNFKKVFTMNYNGKGYEIITRLGYRVKCTPEHRFLTISENGLKWFEAKELRIGNYVGVVGIPQIINGYNIENTKFKLNGSNTTTNSIHALEKGFFIKKGDVYFDEIVCIKTINLDKVYGIIDSKCGNYVVNGFVSKNSSTSLELGIDVGYIDTVVLLSSPKSVSRLLQRIGRAGHKLRNISKGLIIVVDRDDLVECTVLAKAALERKIDEVNIPKNALDVLAQHIVGMALERKWKVKEAYNLVRRSYNYHSLSFNNFLEVLKYLSGAYNELEPMKVYAKIWFNKEEGVFGRRGRGKTRMIYYMNSGTIPDEAKITVITDKGEYIGTVDEPFLQILMPGDVFVLGGRTYKFLRSYGSLVLVKKVEGERPTVPSWFSEMLPLSYDSALLIGAFRRKLADMIAQKTSPTEIIRYLVNEYGLNQDSAKNIYEYIYEQYLFTEGLIPSDTLIVIEVFDEPNRRNIIFHSLFGRRTNDALSRAYASILSKMVKGNVRITITDNGFMLTILPKSINLESLIKSVNSKNIKDILKESLKSTELLRRRFRHCAQRSFMLLKRYMDREKSVHKLQLNAQNMLKVVEEIKDFPILKETYREILEDFMDIEHAIEVLKKIEKGIIKIRFLKPRNIPSPFAHGIIAQGYSDVVLMKDRRALLMKLHKKVMEYLMMHVKEKLSEKQ